MTLNRKWLGIFLLGGIAGIIFWGGFNTFMEYTNSMEFCISCHEMKDNVYEEYLGTPHHTNPSGVRALCSDCHVPKPWVPKLIRKIKASNELYHKLIGTIDTREKFLAERMHLAGNVWKSMMENDSRECRNCHSYDAMHFDKQSKRGRSKMKKAMRKGITCIECHQGVAHELPDEDEYDFEEVLKKAGYEFKEEE